MIWVLILLTWEMAYRFIGWKPWIFPAPSHLLDAFLGLLNFPTAFGDPIHRGWPRAAMEGIRLHAWYLSPLIHAPLVSGIRLLGGFALSITLGATLGLAMWRWIELDKFLGPLFLGMQTLPSVCWVPLAILAFGINERGVLFVLVMGSFFAVAISLRDGLRAIPPLYQRAGLMLGARGWRLYRYVLLPASLPALASSLRQGFSFAWRSLMGAEFVFIAVPNHGLGYLLEQGRNVSDVAQVIAVMIVMVLLGILADRLIFAPLQRRISLRFGLTVE